MRSLQYWLAEWTLHRIYKYNALITAEIRRVDRLNAWIDRDKERLFEYFRSMTKAEYVLFGQKNGLATQAWIDNYGVWKQ